MQPSAFSLGDICVPPMANVLKVFLENGQTKSFKYDAWTTVQDVVNSLQAKLCLTSTEHFSLVVEHIKSLKRNKLTLLDPVDTLSRVRRCLFLYTSTSTRSCYTFLIDWETVNLAKHAVICYTTTCNSIASQLHNLDTQQLIDFVGTDDTVDCSSLQPCQEFFLVFLHTCGVSNKIFTTQT